MILRFFGNTAPSKPKGNRDTLPIKHYFIGHDGNVNHPNFGDGLGGTIYDTVNNFVPCINSAGNCEFLLGDGSNAGSWDTNDSATEGTEVQWCNLGVGLSYNYERVHIKLSSLTGAAFAAASNDGLKRFHLPKTANQTKDGGYIDYYYSNAAWVASGVTKFYIAQNGSVYKAPTSWGGDGYEVPTSSELIVRWDGTPGAAGGGSAISDLERKTIVNGTPTELAIAHFTSATDYGLTSPDENGTYESYTNFIPVLTDSSTDLQMNIDTNVGSLDYTTNNTGVSPGGWHAFIYTAGSPAASYTVVKLQNPGGTVASSRFNGLHRFYLPKSAHYDVLGGFIEYYFNSSAWATAIADSNVTDFFFTKNGSVYGRIGAGSYTISDAYLINRHDGVAGTLGGGTAGDTTRTVII